jgi:hypothetical protein
LDVATRRVSGDLTKSSEPRKAITINRLSKPSKTKRRSKTKDLEDLINRISGKRALDSSEILGDSNESTVGGRKLKAMEIINAITTWRFQKINENIAKESALATRIIHENM